MKEALDACEALTKGNLSKSATVSGRSVHVHVAGEFSWDSADDWGCVVHEQDTNLEDAISNLLDAARAGKRIFVVGTDDRWERSGAIGTHIYTDKIEVGMSTAAHVMVHDPDSLIGTIDGDLCSRIIRMTESPAEERLAVFLAYMLFDGPASSSLEAQVVVGKYRLDFAIQDMKIAVEVDGHDFHERTKEQASRDKTRDRFLVSEGWRVLRFTGSEVWNRPIDCASEVYRVAYGMPIRNRP